MHSAMTQRCRFALWPQYRFGLWPQRRLALWPVGLLLAAGLGLALGACAPVAVGAGAAGVTTAPERGFKDVVADTEIRFEINHLWFQESASLYSKVNLQVQEGRVLLTGNPLTRNETGRGAILENAPVPIGFCGSAAPAPAHRAGGGGVPAAASGLGRPRPALRRGAAGAQAPPTPPRERLAHRRSFAPAAGRA